MKKITLLLSLMIISINFCRGQEAPQVQFASSTSIVGTCDYGSIVYVEYKLADGKFKKDSIKVENGNNFVIKFNEPLKVGSINSIWSTYINYKLSLITTNKQEFTILDDAAIVNLQVKNSSDIKNHIDEEVAKLNELKAEKEALKNTTLTYATSIWSTNFNIPLIRFNLIRADNFKKGDLLIFSSIGAGIGKSWGHLERTRDNRGEIVNEEFSSTFGIHLGALFSASSGEDNKNVFAPTFNLSILDFQIGTGFELGTILPNQRRLFITLSYGIPLYKLFKRNYWLKNSAKIPISSKI